MNKAVFKTYVMLSLVLIITFLSACGGADKTATGKMIDWKYEPTLKEPVQVTSYKQPVTAGDLTANGFRLVVPADSFGSSTQLTIKNPDSVPKVLSSQFTPIGTPVDISGAASRLDQPAAITFRVDTNQYATELKAGRIHIAYYNGTAWEYFPPDAVDATAGTITFNTYHFSTFAYGMVSVEEQIKQYTHSASLAALAQNKVDKLVENMVANVVDMILIDELGWNDKSARYQIVAGLANDVEYRKLVDIFSSKDYEKFNAMLQVYAGKKIVENVDKAAFLSILKGVTKNVGAIAAASEAAGYMAEGQYAEAGRILGEKIANGFLITKLVNAGAEVVQYNIDLWKDAEIEAAFQAYKNGADSKFWGYNVDPGKFDDLWYQMRGIATRLEVEAVDREIRRRALLSMPAPTESELNAVRAQVKKDMEDNFKLRASQEAELEKEAARMEALVKIFQDTRLLEIGMYGYSEANDTLDLRLDKLFHMVAKVLRDTGRQNWNTTAFTNDKEISANDIVSLIKAWYSTDGPDEYAKILKEKFGIDLSIKKYILESGKPVVKSVTADTKEFFNNKFDIIVGSAMLGPGSGQFTSFIGWAGVPTRFSGMMSAIGFWSSPPLGLNPGDPVNIKLQIFPGYYSTVPAAFTITTTVMLNKQPKGELTWTSDAQLVEQNLGPEKTVTFDFPNDFKESAFDIEISSVTPSGSGSEIYHYILNPELAK